MAISSLDAAAGMTAQPPGGARFYRCALQVNPHHYAQTYRGQAAQGDALCHARKIVDKAVQAGIEVLAITDHNSVDGVAAFRAASRNRPIHMFPGFELSSSEGVHLLCLYPPDTGDDQLGRYLGEFGIRETTPSSEPAAKAFAEILAAVDSQGGVAIAAHVTNDGGLFKVLPGQPRIRAWRIRRPTDRGPARGRPRQPLHHRRHRAAHARGEAAQAVHLLDPQRKHSRARSPS